MKRLIIIFVIFFQSILLSQTPNRLGLSLGIGRSIIESDGKAENKSGSFSTYGVFLVHDFSLRNQLQVGFEFTNIHGPYFRTKPADVDDESPPFNYEQNVKQKVTYLELPIILRRIFGSSDSGAKIRYSLLTGLKFGTLLNASEKFTDINSLESSNGYVKNNRHMIGTTLGFSGGGGIQFKLFQNNTAFLEYKFSMHFMNYDNFYRKSYESGVFSLNIPRPVYINAINLSVTL